MTNINYFFRHSYANILPVDYLINILTIKLTAIILFICISPHLAPCLAD